MCPRTGTPRPELGERCDCYSRVWQGEDSAARGLNPTRPSNFLRRKNNTRSFVGVQEREGAKVLNHYASKRFWNGYRDLPQEVRDLADKCYELRKANPMPDGGEVFALLQPAFDGFG